MLRKTALILFFILVSLSAFAFEQADFTNCLGDYAESISQAAYLASERAGSAEKQAFESAADRADKAEKRIRDIISNIETPQDFESAQNTLATFATGSDLNAHTVATVEKLLHQRAGFVSGSAAAAPEINLSYSGRAAEKPELLMNKRQRRLVMIEIPIVEAVISFTDTDKNRRIDNIKNIFSRHSCRILSENSVKNDAQTQVYYFSGRKFVVDAILGQFGGDLVQNDMKAVVRITSGGFWSGKKSVDFNISPNANNGVMGELSWYKSVIEKDPTRYLAENNYKELATLGTIETIAGEKKLQLKNATAEIWVMSKNGSQRNAVYFNKAELGDVYVDAR
ncbi:MAG: hypothetical protein KKB51_20440 [Candidatus Riflebacteria bacterium]|nr:hypothetical protein [Candidatus Riflebacteria bacterium]